MEAVKVLAFGWWQVARRSRRCSAVLTPFLALPLFAASGCTTAATGSQSPAAASTASSTTGSTAEQIAEVIDNPRRFIAPAALSYAAQSRTKPLGLVQTVVEEREFSLPSAGIGKTRARYTSEYVTTNTANGLSTVQREGLVQSAGGDPSKTVGATSILTDGETLALMNYDANRTSVSYLSAFNADGNLLPLRDGKRWSMSATVRVLAVGKPPSEQRRTRECRITRKTSTELLPGPAYSVFCATKTGDEFIESDALVSADLMIEVGRRTTGRNNDDYFAEQRMVGYRNGLNRAGVSYADLTERPLAELNAKTRQEQEAQAQRAQARAMQDAMDDAKQEADNAEMMRSITNTVVRTFRR